MLGLLFRSTLGNGKHLI